MEPALVRTSVTVDEAIAMLLGWVSGPVLFQSVHDDPSPEEEEVRDSLLFSIADELEIMRDECESELAQAQVDGCSATVIADKRAATQKYAALVGDGSVHTTLHFRPPAVPSAAADACAQAPAVDWRGRALRAA